MKLTAHQEHVLRRSVESLHDVKFVLDVLTSYILTRDLSELNVEAITGKLVGIREFLVVYNEVMPND